MTSARSEEDLRAELEGLQKEAQKLNEARIRAETEIERAKEESKKLEEELEKEFGTSDLEEVERQLTAREKANSEKVDQYRAKIESTRQSLEKIMGILAAHRS